MSKTPYLNPLDHFPSPKLERILALVPSYREPALQTSRMLKDLMGSGVDILASSGCSDPALHRCLIAGRALKVLTEMPDKWDYVVWIDDDIVGSTSHYAFMRAACVALDAPVSGIYCKRNDPTMVCIRRMTVQSIESRQVMLEEGNVTFISEPVTAGMGAIMMKAEHFIYHCQSVPLVVSPDNAKDTKMPGICASGMCPDKAGNVGWVSEDMCYCQSLWHYQLGLWSLPIVFGHVSSIPLYPNSNAEWLGSVKEETTS